MSGAKKKVTKKLSKTLTGLKSKKKYYFKIRTLKSVNGRIYYSDYSKPKKIKG